MPGRHRFAALLELRRHPAFNAGSLVCGTHNNAPVLMWTKDDLLLLGQVQGPDLSSLNGWSLRLG